MSDKSTLQSLLTRVEAAHDFDRDLDRDIGVTIDGWRLSTQPNGLHVIEVRGCFYADHPGGIYPGLTESIDDALALVSRALPAHQVNLHCYHVDASASIGSASEPLSEAVASTPALAICTALLRALIARAEAADLEVMRPA